MGWFRFVMVRQLRLGQMLIGGTCNGLMRQLRIGREWIRTV